MRCSAMPTKFILLHHFPSEVSVEIQETHQKQAFDCLQNTSRIRSCTQQESAKDQLKVH